MKNSKFNRAIFAILASLFLFSSCQETIEFNGKETEPDIVLYSFVQPEKKVEARLGYSKFIFTSEKIIPDVANAKVKLFVNDEYKENLRYVKLEDDISDNLLFVGSNYVAKIGDKLELKVTGIRDVDEVSAKLTVLPRPTILGIDTTQITERVEVREFDSISDRKVVVGYYDRKRINFSMKVKDVGLEKNFYRLIAFQRVWMNDGTHFERDIKTNDLIFKTENNNKTIFGFNVPENRYLMFTDQKFNGGTYDIKFEIDMNYAVQYLSDSINWIGNNPEKSILYVELQHVSKEFYYYTMSLNNAVNSSNIPFIEPVQVYSNVKNGIGVFGAYSSASLTEIYKY